MSYLTSGKVYIITNKMGHTVMDISPADQESVTGYKLTNGDNQKWRVVQGGNNKGGSWWTLQSIYNGGYLDFQMMESKPANGDRVVGVLTTEPRKWTIKSDEKDSSAWRISPLGTETEMDVDLSDHGNPKDGTPITLWGKWEGENQVWKFQEAY